MKNSVRIKLKKYNEAIDDCDWAWRASNDRCPKARFNQDFNLHLLTLIKTLDY